MVRTIGRPHNGGVDRADPTPLHHQTRRGLLELIDGDGLRPGDQLPSEAELAQRFGVSRQTLRQAVDALERENVLYRQRPKGTFVGFGAVEGDLQVLRSVWEDLRRLGMQPTARVLDLASVPAGDEVGLQLGLEPTDRVIRLRRVFQGNGTPVALDIVHFLSPAFDWLFQEELATSWYDLFHARGLDVLYARTKIGAVNASPKTAAHLAVEPGQALLELQRHSYTRSDQLLAYSQTQYRPDRYNFSVVLSRPTASAPQPPTEN